MKVSAAWVGREPELKVSDACDGRLPAVMTRISLLVCTVNVGSEPAMNVPWVNDGSVPCPKEPWVKLGRVPALKESLA